jgi:hypothetical protein
MSVKNNKNSTKKMSFWQTVKAVFQPTKQGKVFPWLQSGLVLVGFAAGVLVTTGVDLISRYASSESTTDVVSEADKCREKGGRYDESDKNCILVTSDRGTDCTDNSDCEGWCIVDDSAEIGSEEGGSCTESYNVGGCVKFMDNGKVNSICLP